MNLRYRALFSLALTLFMWACADPAPKPFGPCTASRSTKVIRALRYDRVDLLIVVDNSASMAEEQVLLRAQLPNLIRALTTGALHPGDVETFRPLRDLHVGVVSSDLGLAGVELPSAGCRADGGDNGALQHLLTAADCQDTYPKFLSYVGHTSLGPLTDPVQFGRDVACIGTLGNRGCGFEHQLEAPFKALSLMAQLDGNDALGFLRNDVNDGISMLGILIVTDEDDCSLSSTEQWESASPSDPNDVDPSCHAHKEWLHDLTRYYEGFRKLRPGREELVQFMALAGIPPDLVDQKRLAAVDFTLDDPSRRNAFYDAILNDPRMQEQPDPQTEGKLKPSCTRTSPQGSATAYPPRRIVELARLFDKYGMVQSICQHDFVPVVAPFINIIANELTEPCHSRALVRRPDGTVACDMIWELPATLREGSRAPTQCSEVPFLGPVDDSHPKTNAKGGNNCKMHQLPVHDTAAGQPPEGQGWYYDDYSADVKLACKYSQRKITFAFGSQPPSEVTARLVCEDHTQHYPNKRKDLSQAVRQPEIGSGCTDPNGLPKDDACVLTLLNNATLSEMFCHATDGTCVRSCVTDADCPPGWGCDNRPESLASAGERGAYCINLACGRPD